ARHSVRHFLADFRKLEASYPDEYPRLVVRAEGAHVWDAEGRRLLDAGGHLGACQVGHGRQEIAERIARQVAELDFIALHSVLSLRRGVDRAARLAGLGPVGPPFFPSPRGGSGSTGLASKRARPYPPRRGDEPRPVVLSRDGSYHGSSFGAMSATGAPAFRAG